MNMDNARQAFIEEVAELLQSMEDALLILEDNSLDPESLHNVFRAMHTIKGTAGVFGYMPIVDFTHAVETVMDKVRSGQEPMTEQLIATLFECRDHTALLVESIADSVETDDLQITETLSAAGEKLLVQLGKQHTDQSSNSPSAIPQAQTSESFEDSSSASDIWVISLDFGRDALRNGMDPLSFLRYLGSLGEIVHVTTLWDGISQDDNFDPESCYLRFRILFKSEADKPTIAAVFEFAEDDCDIHILPPQSSQQQYFTMLESLSEGQVMRLGEMLINIGALTKQELESALSSQHGDQVEHPEGTPARLGDILTGQGSVKTEIVEQAVKTQTAVRTKRAEEARFIRVDAQRLGRLINLVGELVTSSAAIRVMMQRAGLDDMSEVVDSVDYLVEEIRDNALQLRMVPVGDTLSRFRRVVRDASKELNKKIDLLITGGETELDKTVVEKITDPLTHLVRNAVDHGIESPQIREQNGKSATGTIRLNAYHDSGHIVIEISDDGAGLDPERIRAKAEANGLIQPGQTLTLQETLQLIFEPGLSTKEQASSLSGRGVGMDVVCSNIEALRGSVELQSTPGKGTTVTIILPLTLAIIDGFLVGANGERYVIPLAQVAECVEIDREAKTQAQRYINLRGEVLPYLRIRDYFDEGPAIGITDAINRESLVVVRVGHTKAGLVVDELHGELQTVIKPLGRLFEGLKGVTGATVLGTGEVALILDVQELANLAHAQAGFITENRRSRIRAQA